jgi:hypothetical protein
LIFFIHILFSLFPVKDINREAGEDRAQNILVSCKVSSLFIRVIKMKNIKS